MLPSTNIANEMIAHPVAPAGIADTFQFPFTRVMKPRIHFEKSTPFAAKTTDCVGLGFLLSHVTTG